VRHCVAWVSAKAELQAEPPDAAPAIAATSNHHLLLNSNAFEENQREPPSSSSAKRNQTDKLDEIHPFSNLHRLPPFAFANRS
jgi:hypothetical protein